MSESRARGISDAPGLTADCNTCTVHGEIRAPLSAFPCHCTRSVNYSYGERKRLYCRLKRLAQRQSNDDRSTNRIPPKPGVIDDIRCLSPAEISHVRPPVRRDIWVTGSLRVTSRRHARHVTDTTALYSQEIKCH